MKKESQARRSQDAGRSDKPPRKPASRRLARRPPSIRPAGGTLTILNTLPLLPLLVAVGVVPLVVFLKLTPVPPDYRDFWMTNHIFDFFAFYKAQLLLLCAGLVLLAALALYGCNRLPCKQSALFIPLAVYAALVVASTVASEHPSIALHGFFERSEGMWVLLAYVVLLVGAYLFVTEAAQVWLILSAWAAALSIISLLGVFQFFGLDFFSSWAGRRLILPEPYQPLAPVLNFNFPQHTLYATLYNPNNVANMMAMAFPLAATVFAFARSRRRQMAFGALAGLLGLTLVGANSRGGWVAALLALLLLAALSARKGVAGGWLRLGLLALVVVVEFGFLNHVSGNTLGRRTGGLTAEPAMPKVEPGTSQSAADKAEGPPDKPADEGRAPAMPEGPAERLIRQYGTVASGRGYIWIRSLSTAGNTLLLGRGPDTFALYFPNRDPYKAFSFQPQAFIDKPHNMYLQLWLNLGGVATLAFLTMVLGHGARTPRILKQANPTSDRYVLALGLYVGWVGYLLAGFFYDSTVSVAPVFWIVFGLSMALNEAIETADSACVGLKLSSRRN